MHVTTIGLDLAKNVFQVHGITDDGNVVFNRALRRAQVLSFFEKLEVGPVTSEVRELSAQTISRVRGSDEAREGFAAFLDKRPANWIPQ